MSISTVLVFLNTKTPCGMTEGVTPHPDARSTNKRDGEFPANGILLRSAE